MNPPLPRSLPPIKDHLLQHALPFLDQRDLYLPFSLKVGTSGEEILLAALEDIWDGQFDKYTQGTVALPFRFEFSEIKRRRRPNFDDILQKYAGWFLIEDRNHVPRLGDAVGYFYYNRNNSETPYFCVRPHLIRDTNRLKALIEPYLSNADETIEIIDSIISQL